MKYKRLTALAAAYSPCSQITTSDAGDIIPSTLHSHPSKEHDQESAEKVSYSGSVVRKDALLNEEQDDFSRRGNGSAEFCDRICREMQPAASGVVVDDGAADDYLTGKSVDLSDGLESAHRVVQSSESLGEKDARSSVIEGPSINTDHTDRPDVHDGQTLCEFDQSDVHDGQTPYGLDHTDQSDTQTLYQIDQVVVITRQQTTVPVRMLKHCFVNQTDHL